MSLLNEYKPEPWPLWRPTQFMCTVPAELGKVTKLEVKDGKLIVRTESGTTMIVPHPRKD